MYLMLIGLSKAECKIIFPQVKVSVLADCYLLYSPNSTEFKSEQIFSQALLSKRFQKWDQVGMRLDLNLTKSSFCWQIFRWILPTPKTALWIIDLWILLHGIWSWLSLKVDCIHRFSLRWLQKQYCTHRVKEVLKLWFLSVWSTF